MVERHRAPALASNVHDGLCDQTFSEYVQLIARFRFDRCADKPQPGLHIIADAAL
jgi:hypothetical protein